MSIDAGGRQPEPPRPDWSVPELLALEIRWLDYTPPRLRNFESRLPHSARAVEFLVETDQPFPARALSPALYVGDEAVTEGESTTRTRHRFVALDPDRLQFGAAISLGWPGQPAATRRSTRYHYEPPAE